MKEKGGTGAWAPRFSELHLSLISISSADGFLASACSLGQAMAMTASSKDVVLGVMVSPLIQPLRGHFSRVRRGLTLRVGVRPRRIPDSESQATLVAALQPCG